MDENKPRRRWLSFGVRDLLWAITTLGASITAILGCGQICAAGELQFPMPPRPSIADSTAVPLLPPLFEVGPPPAPTVQILFASAERLKVDHDFRFGGDKYLPIQTPGRADFPTESTVHLKISKIRGWGDQVLDASLQIYPITPMTEKYVATKAIPLRLTQDDIDESLRGNGLSRAYYLPHCRPDEEKEVEFETAEASNKARAATAAAARKGVLLAVLILGKSDPPDHTVPLAP